MRNYEPKGRMFESCRAHHKYFKNRHLYVIEGAMSGLFPAQRVTTRAFFQIKGLQTT